MTESTPEHILARAQVPSANGRPIRKDEIELHDRGIYIESWLPERRSRRKPLLFVHGELAGSWIWERFLGYFASRGWEGHALNLQNHFWSRTVDPTQLTFDSYVEDVVVSLNRLGPTTVVIGHGLGGLLALKAAERAPVGGLVFLSPEPPSALRDAAAVHQLRDVPDVYGRARIGWSTLPEKLQRDHRDLTIGDVLRIQHLLGQKPHESGRARRSVLAGIAVDPRHVAEIPRLVIGAGLDTVVPEPTSERFAAWLGAEYEPFGAHSHYGLIVGEQSHQQVADAIRGFLEAHRL
ncbi:MAG TPA: alpha/beta fold hydrolase [Candidatus Limnocylindrales bacterium]|nr:alpha/beta fold hydrolase [Candidatus Limnocylindrales bacterium]